MKLPFKVHWVVYDILKGRKIGRAIQNSILHGASVKGTIADLGAKAGASSLYDHLNTKDAELNYFDITPNSKSVKTLDLENILPFRDNEFEYVILSHVIECIYNNEQLLSEINRISIRGALIIVPFFVGYHGEPHDYYRYTRDALKLKLEKAGFPSYSIIDCGYGPFTLCVHVLSRIFYFRVVKVLFFILGVLLDKFLFLVGAQKSILPIHYIVWASNGVKSKI